MLGRIAPRRADAGKPEILDRRPAPDPPGGLGIATGLFEPLGRVVAVSRDAPVVLAGPFTHRRPPIGVHAEVCGAGGRVEGQVEDWRWIEDLPAFQLSEDRSGQGDVSSQRRMMRVLDDIVAEQAGRADRGQLATPVDQDAPGMPARHVFVGGAKGCRAADGQSIVIERSQIVAARLGQPALLFQQPRQPEVGFGETRVPREDRRIPAALAAGSRDSRRGLLRNS